MADRRRRLEERRARQQRIAKDLNAQLLKERQERNLRGDGPKIGMKRDPVEVPGQKYAVISYVAPHTTPQHCKYIAVKIRGVFNALQEANQRAEEVSHFDPDFQVDVVEMYEWLVIPPPVDLQAAVPYKYQQEKLQQLVDGHYRSIERGRTNVQQRMQRSVDEGREKAARYRAEHNLSGAAISRAIPESENVEHPAQVVDHSSGGGGAHVRETKNEEEE